MRKKLITALVLGACVSTSLFAQTVVKQDTMTISLTGVKQSSVSTSATQPNAGNWSSGPMYYKTTPIKVTDKDIIKYIAMSLYKNANHYGTRARLVLVQGELSGFFNITPDLALSMPDNDGTPVDPWFNDQGGSADGDSSTALANSFDSTTFQLANGRHWDVNPYVPTMYPVGHLQPWGQIYIQDPDRGSDNVTFYFAISIEECYDCFYLNSFVSTATFKTVNTAPNGPPCCVGTSVIVGSGKDAYYMTFSFDNTDNNPYLYKDLQNPLYFGDEVGDLSVEGVKGGIPGDAILPDTIYNPGRYTIAYNLAIAGGATVNDAIAAAQLAAYIDSIKSGGVLAGPFGTFPSPYQARFTLNGVLTYTWKLGYIDKTDLSPDFMGTGSYVANGYGFIGLYCSLFNTATVTFNEAAVKTSTIGLVTGEAWADDWIGIGAEYVIDPGESLNGETTPYANWVAYGMPTYSWTGGEVQYPFGAGYPTPINVTTSLSYHQDFNHAYPSHYNSTTWSAWPSPGQVKSWYMP